MFIHTSKYTLGPLLGGIAGFRYLHFLRKLFLEKDVFGIKNTVIKKDKIFQIISNIWSL